MGGQHDDGGDGWNALALIAVPLLLAGLIWEGLTWPFRKVAEMIRKPGSKGE